MVVVAELHINLRPNAVLMSLQCSGEARHEGRVWHDSQWKIYGGLARSIEAIGCSANQSAESQAYLHLTCCLVPSFSTSSTSVFSSPMLRNLTRFFYPAAWTPTRTFASTAPRFRPLDMEQVDTTDRLAHLRQLMKSHKVDIYSKTRKSPLNTMAD